MPDFDTDPNSISNKSLAISVSIAMFFNMIILSIGYSLGQGHPQYVGPANIIFYISFGLLVFLLVIQKVRFTFEIKKIEKISVSEFNDQFDSEKKEAAKMHKSGELRKMNRKLQFIVFRAHAFFVCVFIIGIIVSFSGGCSSNRLSGLIGLFVPLSLFGIIEI